MLLVGSFYSHGNDLFVSDNQERIAQVELFEFDSLEQQKRAISLAKSLRCPQCQNQNLVESNSPMAMDLRLVVYQKIKQGQSDQEIIEFMTNRYGEFVRYNPGLNSQTLVLWFAPLALLGLLAFIIYVLFKKSQNSTKND
nr:heme lyase NrfEFG subunit NrfF [Vibrio ulleungensis]